MVSENVKSRWVAEDNVNQREWEGKACQTVTLTVWMMENVNTHTREQRKPRHKLLRKEKHCMTKKLGAEPESGTAT